MFLLLDVMNGMWSLVVFKVLRRPLMFANRAARRVMNPRMRIIAILRFLLLFLLRLLLLFIRVIFRRILVIIGVTTVMTLVDLVRLVCRRVRPLC